MSAINPNNVGYGLSQALVKLAPSPVISLRNPATSDSRPLGTWWVNKSTNNAWLATSVATGQTTWTGATGGAGAFATLSSVTTTAVGSDLTVVGTNITGGATTIGGLTTMNGGATIVGALAQTGGATSLGTHAAADAINIGTGAAAKVITIGNIIGATGVDLRSGTQGIGLTATNGNIDIVSGTGDINLGADAVAKVITIGNNTGTTSVDIVSGALGVGIVCTNANFDLTTGTGDINIGIDATVNNIFIGTGAAVKTVQIGSINTTSATIINAGTAGILLNSDVMDITVNTQTVASPATNATANVNVIVATYTGFTTAAAASQTLTVTSNKILATSGIFVTVASLDVSTNGAALSLISVVQAVGSIDVTYKNNGGAALGAGDNVIITVWIIS
jgi:hypothetical protein